MKWTTLQHSKSAVRKAGECIIEIEDDSTLSLDLFIRKITDSYRILNNWRSSHAYPLQSMLMHFRNKALEVDRNAIVVQRLKRTPSILSKLRRESGMKLDRIEDIGGCRIVVPKLSDVYNVRDAIVESRTRNILKRERDYIKEPKPSGYRGIHLIYKYNGNKNEFSNHHIELQIRSKLQHAWATAVEVVGTFTQQALKASQGEDTWLQFFELASVAFKDIENNDLKKNSQSRERIALLEHIEKYDILTRLKAFAVSTKHLGKTDKKQRDFYLLILEIDTSYIQVKRFYRHQLESANEEYIKYEERFKGNKQKDVVLVSAESINSIKKAYPNYFADTEDFTKNLESIILNAL